MRFFFRNVCRQNLFKYWMRWKLEISAIHPKLLRIKSCNYFSVTHLSIFFSLFIFRHFKKLCRVEFNDYESNNRIYLAMAKLYKIKKDQIHRFILKRRVSLWAASNLCQILPPTLRWSIWCKNLDFQTKLSFQNVAFLWNV